MLVVILFASLVSTLLIHLGHHWVNRRREKQLRKEVWKDVLWQDPRDKPGYLTCRLCEDVVAPGDYESHAATHTGRGWVKL